MRAAVSPGSGRLSVDATDSDDDETSSIAAGASGAPLTEAEFLEQDNAICSAGNKELDQALVAAGDSDDPFADVGKEATAIGLDQCAG